MAGKLWYQHDTITDTVQREYLVNRKPAIVNCSWYQIITLSSWKLISEASMKKVTQALHQLMMPLTTVSNSPEMLLVHLYLTSWQCLPIHWSGFPHFHPICYLQPLPRTNQNGMPVCFITQSSFHQPANTESPVTYHHHCQISIPPHLAKKAISRIMAPWRKTPLKHLIMSFY